MVPETASVVFDHVSFAFDEQVVLRDISFQVPAGSMRFLLGASGSGKSDGARGTTDRCQDPRVVTTRLSIAALFVLLLTCVGVRDAAAQVRAEGYGIIGPVFWTGYFGAGATLHGAGGGELVTKAVGVGGELGLLDYGVLVSANGSYHFGADPDRKSRFFVTGGFTHVSADGSFTAWNIGAGVNHWNGRHVGVRFDVRDHIRPDDRGTVQYWSVRGGIVIR